MLLAQKAVHHVEAERPIGLELLFREKLVERRLVREGRVAPRVVEHEIILVAAHSWDIAGALAFGCRAGFVARAGKALSPVLRPDFETKDVASMAEVILSARADGAE